jgi:predicted PurR-regulated permease PerM
MIGGLLTFIILSLLSELQQLANTFAVGYEHILLIWPEQGGPLQQAVAARLPTSDTFYEALSGGEEFSNLPTMLEIIYNITENVAYFIVVIILSMYWTVDQVRFERLWLSLLSIKYRAPARELWRKIEFTVGAYLRSELIQSLLAGLLLWFGYWLIGLNYPTVLALIGAIVWLIPVIGLFLALIPVIILGLTNGLLLGLIAGFYTLLIFWVLEWVIEPRFFDRRRFSGLLLVLVMIAFIDGIGLLGLIIAPPVAVSIQIFFRWFIHTRLPLTNEKTIPELVDLQERVATIEARLASEETEPSPQVVSMLERLKDLLAEARKTPLTSSTEQL